MSITSAKFARGCSVLFVCIAALAAACSSSNSSPTAPSSSASTPPPPPPGAVTASVQITVNPNPVPFSGTPITDAAQCAGYADTWFYDQVLQEFGGTDVKFTTRVDTFDDKLANNLTGLNISVPAHGSAVLHTRWCSGAGIAHTAQTTLTGTDAKGNVVTVTGPVARLMAPGK